MKKYHFLFIIIIVFILYIRCDVDKNPLSGYSYKYDGKWRLIIAIGGLVPYYIIPEEGSFYIIQYDKGNRFRIFKNDTLKATAKYRVEKEDNYYDLIFYEDIVTYDFNFNHSMENAFIHGDTLETWYNHHGRCSGLYIKE